MEHFAQTNVFSRIRTVFARIRTVFAHLIIGCAIRYPKIGCLRYIRFFIVNPVRYINPKDHYAGAVCKMGYEMKLASYTLNAFMNFRMRILLYFVVVQPRIFRKPFHLKSEHLITVF